MAGMGDQMKMLNKMRKLQAELKKEIVEVEAGDGAVIIQINGEMKVVDLKLDAEKIDPDNMDELAGWIKAAFRDGIKEAQEMAAEKMKPMMGNLGNMGF
jgi:DNA-binding YbaB/EbfC family protein